ncbi:unnamed protein product [Auanema sp. JU1783]|nr:unnamed protein product [Auanema sp. JU1783]
MKVILTYFVYIHIFNIVCYSRYIEDDGTILLPVQHVKQENGIYVTYKDVQVGDPDYPEVSVEEEAKKVPCIPRDQANKFKESSESHETQENMFVFNDTTPYNGTDVNEVMEVRIFRPLCDD